MFRKIISFNILIINLLPVYSQIQDTTTNNWYFASKETRSTGLILGIHQHKSTFFEIGISRATKLNNHCAFGYQFLNYSLSAEYNPINEITGITLTSYKSWGIIFIAGANLNIYTDFNNYNCGIKPFIGLGPGNISITYGYNFQYIDNNVIDINKHCFSLRYYWAIKK